MIEPKYCILFEDPHDIDSPVRRLIPDPRWLENTMLKMTEEKAMERLAKQDLPPEVLKNEGNRLRYNICRRDQLPKNTKYRNAWRLAS